MKILDLSANKLDVIYRGANAGHKIMSDSCFYSYDKEIAEDYAMMNSKPCLYTFCVDGLNFLVVEENWMIDGGATEFEKEEIEKYDGVRTANYAQVLLFGEFDCTTGKFTKSDYETVINMAQSEERRYDR